MLDPEGKRLLTLEQAASARNFQLSRGRFLLRLKRPVGKQSLFAAHADRRESDLSVIPQETLSLWKATGEECHGGWGPQHTGGPQDTKQPWPIWPILLILLLLVAMAESVIVDRYTAGHRWKNSRG